MNQPSEISWLIAPLSHLSALDMHDLLRLRVDVFIVEQSCIYAEIDGQDPGSLHVLGRSADGSLAAYARILPPHADGLPHIGRVAVHPDHRGARLGHRLMERTLQAVHEHYGSDRSALAAQTHLRKFYEQHGYRVTSAEYMWDGILHVDMLKENGTSGSV